MRGALLGKFGAYTWDRSRTVFLYGGFSSDVLTPLDESAAPKLWTLPRDIQNPLRDTFYKLCGDYSWDEKYAAQDWLGAATQRLIDANLDLAYDHEQIRERASRYAEICSRITTVSGLERFCAAVSVEPPGTKNASGHGRLARSRNIPWWTRRLFKRYSRAAENGLRMAGFISRTKSLYSSGIACRARQRRAEILNEWIDRTSVVSNEGDRVALRQVYDASLAHPTNRRHELMTRLRGMDELADAAGLVADFYTLTLPSKYHAMHSAGEVNAKFNGATVRDGQLELRRLWSKFRARAAKQEIFYYGMRVAEPHHDGTPHWHMVLYTLADHRDAVRALLREYWLSVDGFEPGAQQHRIRIMACNRAVGSAAGYLAKYIAKNIDGYEVGADLEREGTGPGAGADGDALPPEAAPQMDAEATAPRVLTWAWLHGIRQFQFFGTARVGLWRELRRLRDPVLESEPLERARAAADSGEWSAFVDAIGGVFAGPNTTLRLWKEVTGELNQYDELMPPQVVGIEAPDGYLRTRLLIWRLEPAVTVSDTGPSFGKEGTGNPFGWTNPRETSMYGPQLH